jgi:diaminopimelate decarboxylase
MPGLAEQLDGTPPLTESQTPLIPEKTLRDLQSLDLSQLSTPCSLYFKEMTAARFDQVARLISTADDSTVRVQVAYSIKTDPDVRLLRAALDHDMLAEAISQAEVERALSVGFSADRIVLNGPAKWWPRPVHGAADYRFVFADSIEELRAYAQLPLPRVGIRLRFPLVSSRFGVPLDTHGAFSELATVLRDYPEATSIGLHFHLASSALGIDRWWRLYDSLLGWAKAIEGATEREVSCLDIGGGWFPEDWDRSLAPRVETAVGDAAQALPSLREVILEPGRALAQPSHGLAVRVVEVRHVQAHRKEVVVDGAKPDLPVAELFPHRILAQEGAGEWRTLGRGHDRLLGRVCMEDDILATDVLVPDWVEPGSLLIVCDAGAYDRSRSFAFGRG